MKILRVIILILSLGLQESYSQNKTIQIIHSSYETGASGKDDIMNFTLRNNSNKPVFITNVKIELVAVRVKSEVDKVLPGELIPTTYWDIALGSAKAKYSYNPPYPIQINSKEGQTIQIRFTNWIGPRGGKFRLPVKKAGYFKFHLSFVDSEGQVAKKSNIELGDPYTD